MAQPLSVGLTTNLIMFPALLRAHNTLSTNWKSNELKMVKKKLTAGSKKAIAATEMRNSAKAQKTGHRRAS